MSTLPQAHSRRSSPAAVVFAAFLTKLAKHLALIACLAIAGHATGRVAVGATTIFFLVVAATVIHAVGRKKSPLAPLFQRGESKASRNLS